MEGGSRRGHSRLKRTPLEKQRQQSKLMKTNKNIDALPRPSAKGADPRGHPAAAEATYPRGRPTMRVCGRQRAFAPPPLPAARHDHRGRSATSAATSPRGRSRGTLISTAASLRSPSSPLRSSAATHPHGCPRGPTFDAAVPRHRPRRQAALPLPTAHPQ